MYRITSIVGYPIQFSVVENGCERLVSSCGRGNVFYSERSTLLLEHLKSRKVIKLVEQKEVPLCEPSVSCSGGLGSPVVLPAPSCVTVSDEALAVAHKKGKPGRNVKAEKDNARECEGLQDNCPCVSEDNSPVAGGVDEPVCLGVDCLGNEDNLGNDDSPENACECADEQNDGNEENLGVPADTEISPEVLGDADAVKDMPKEAVSAKRSRAKHKD